ncbi:hypothetical protein ACO2Q8_22465 [Larkinella sp. VNQ87]|uniref:hypothetical protein n=1 Tax=Larkinella sp. VNQ87 TaxID=3400921 RepID=UPI003C03247C
MRHALRLGILLGLGTSLSSYGQQWTGGLKGIAPISLEVSRFYQQIDEFEVVESNSGDARGQGWGLFARYDRPRWYSQVEANRGRYYMPGLYFSSDRTSSGAELTLKRQDIRLIGGYKPLPWLRINAGVVGNWNRRAYSYNNQAHIQYLEDQIRTYPAQREYYEPQVKLARMTQAVRDGFKRFNTEAQGGLGVDIGGLTLDLTYTRSLSPILDQLAVGGQSYRVRQQYGFWSLSAGYRLFPLKTFLLQPRKNKRTYERIKQSIPYYRNEVGAGLGVTSDDFGGSWLYENRYTRYIHRRIGLTAVVGLVRSFEDYSGFLPEIKTGFQVAAQGRFLPLYTRRHQLGLAVGPVYTMTSGISPAYGSGTYTSDGQVIGKTITVRPDSRRKNQSLGSQLQVDYQFMPTDRIPVGVWFRHQQNRALTYVAMGFQMGYRF